MRSRISRSVLAAIVAGCISLPATGYDAGLTTTGRPVSTLLPDDRDEPLGSLALFAPAALIIALTALGLTITFRSLRQDLRARRIVYQPRGRRPRDAAA